MRRHIFKKKKFWNKKMNRLTVGDTVVLSGILTILCCLPFVGPLVAELKD